MSKKPQMFISYAHSDKETVKNIYGQLLKLPMIKPWMDDKDILVGERWEIVVKRAIRESQFFLLCLSPNSIQHRGVLQKEIKFALDVLKEKLDEDLFLIPTWIQAGPIPKDEMPDSLREYHWLNLSDPDSWNKLAKAVGEQLRRLGQAPAAAGFEAAAAAGSAPQTDFKATEFIAELKQALDSSDEAAVAFQCATLLAHLRRADHPLHGRDAARILRHLSRNNLLEHSGAVADALLLAGSDDAAVRRVYAWSLLERGLLQAPLTILENLNAETANDPAERAEVGKLRGRVYTRIYLDAGDTSGARVQKALSDAVNAYTQVYDADPKRHLLHGGRAAALLLRAERDGHKLSGDHTPRELAEAVMGELKDREEFEEDVSLSDEAAAVDACLALGQHAAAVEWLTRLADDEGAGLSALVEAHHQLRDVWQLEPDEEPGASLLPLLSRRLGALQRARLSPAPVMTVQTTAETEAVRQAVSELEEIFGEDKVVTLKWYKQGLERTNSVACIQGPDGRTKGTGFLVSARDFLPERGDELLFLTTAYLLTNDEMREKLPFVVINPEEAVITFTNPGKSYRVGEILWTSPTAELDATLIRLDPPVDGLDPLPIAPQLPQPGEGARVFAIGHPGGRDLELSLADSFLIDHDGKRLHYTIPTEPGSGGSPILDADWGLIGLHHKRSRELPRLHGKPGIYDAGEGISIHAIIRALQTGSVPQAALE